MNSISCTIRNYFLLTGLICIFISPVEAQDSLASNDDPFSAEAFDNAVTSGNNTDSISKLTYLTGVTFISEATGERLSGSGATGADARFFGKAFVKASKADIGALYLSCNFNYFLFAAANNDVLRRYYSAQNPNAGAINTALSEFHFSFDIYKTVFVRIGNQLISWGATYFWSPEDFINRQKNQAAALSVVDIRSGKPGLRIHLPLPSANIFLFTDFSGVTINNTINDFSETIAQAWRLDKTLFGVNIGTVGYVTKNKPLQIGFDATGSILSADIYGELGLTFVNAEKSAPDYALSIGGSKTLGPEQNWTVRGEFYYNDKGFSDTAISLIRSSFTPLYSGKYYAYAEISSTKLFTSILGTSIFAYANLADLSYSATVQFNFAVPGVLPFSVYGRYAGGKSDREFTSLFGDEALQGGVRIRGDF